MPIYAYRCAACGHAKDVLQKLSDPLLTVCPVCGAEAFTKQVTAAGFQLKGSGWYVTDFRGGNTAKGEAKPEGDAASVTEGDKGAGKAADPAADKAPNAATGKAADAAGDKSAAGNRPADGGKGGASGGSSADKGATPAPAPAPSTPAPPPAAG